MQGFAGHQELGCLDGMTDKLRQQQRPRYVGRDNPNIADRWADHHLSVDRVLVALCRDNQSNSAGSVHCRHEGDGSSSKPPLRGRLHSDVLPGAGGGNRCIHQVGETHVQHHRLQFLESFDETQNAGCL